MASEIRPVPTTVVVCDICGEPIPEDTDPTERGSLLAGYIARPVTPRTRWAWLDWPSNATGVTRRRAAKAGREYLPQRRYDFHGECITRLVTEAAARDAETARAAAEEAWDGAADAAGRLGFAFPADIKANNPHRTVRREENDHG